MGRRREAAILASAHRGEKVIRHDGDHQREEAEQHCTSARPRRALVDPCRRPQLPIRRYLLQTSTTYTQIPSPVLVAFARRPPPCMRSEGATGRVGQVSSSLPCRMSERKQIEVYWKLFACVRSYIQRPKLRKYFYPKYRFCIDHHTCSCTLI